MACSIGNLSTAMDALRTNLVAVTLTAARPANATGGLRSGSAQSVRAVLLGATRIFVRELAAVIAQTGGGELDRNDISEIHLGDQESRVATILPIRLPILIVGLQLSPI